MNTWKVTYVLLWPKLLSQKSQLKFFDSSWTIFLWFCRLLSRPNDFEQISHGYFVFIPSCIFLTWIFKINSSLKYLQQCWHWCCFDPSTWIFLKWVSSVVFCRKNRTCNWWYPYARNQYGFFFLSGRVNVSLQYSHKSCFGAILYNTETIFPKSIIK